MRWSDFLQSDYAWHSLLLGVTFLTTWLPSLKGNFVSDDIEGIRKFSDRYDSNEDKLINDYEIEENGQKRRINNRAYNAAVGFPGSVIRWLRLNLGAKFEIVGKNKKGHSVYGYVQSPFRHHLINLVIQTVNIALAYFFLRQITTPHIALSTTLLFTVHPLGCQTVAWCSGIGYLLSLLGILTAVNIPFVIPDIHYGIGSSIAALLFSVFGMMAGVGLWLVYAVLGFKEYAIAAFIIGLYCLAKQGRSLVDYRVKEFKKQQMERSTYFNWRKPIIMVKTLYYYLKLMAFPKRLGLFHSWGYHFEETIERIDATFWKGLVCIAGLAYIFALGILPVQLGLIWIVAFIAIFLNFITAQQFVADRYAFIPSFGFALVIAYALQDYPVVFAFICGIYLMRTWAHLPTFDNEVKFYQSNAWNFPNSEVALGNLGVVYTNLGFPGAAADMWFMAAKMNPLYDVPHYNLYSMFKSSGQLEQAREFLQRCLNGRIVHFPDMWKKEMEELNIKIAQKKEIDQLNARMNQAFSQNNFEEMTKVKKEIETRLAQHSQPPANSQPNA